MATTLAASGACIIKAGAGLSTDWTTNVSGQLSADAKWTLVINQAESLVNAQTRKNWTDIYAGLNVDTKLILEQCVSDLAAMYAIQYDQSGILQREAETRLDVLKDSANRALAILKKQEEADFISPP